MICAEAAYASRPVALLKTSDGALTAGTKVGRYRIEELVGQGGMGSVYRAVSELSGETVALKLMKPELAGDELKRRFDHEARAASEVKHSHLVPLLDYGQADGRRYIAMRYVAGRSLQQRIEAEGPLPVPDVVRIAAEVGSGLDALHEHGLVHRDVKTANVMLDRDGSASLTDFGLAKGPGFSALTRPGRVLGTLDYAAPEVLRGEPAGPLSDIYALGCVVYESLSGNAPFRGNSMFELGMAVLADTPPDPCAHRGDAPQQLSSTVLLALAKDPAARPQTAIAYANLLTVSARST